MENKDRKSMFGSTPTWKQVKDVVYPAPAPRSWAKLAQIQPVARDFLDLSVYYYMRLKEGQGLQALRAWITENMLHEWDISAGELDSQAAANAKADGYAIKSIEDMLGVSAIGLPIYVLTNQGGCCGAAGMLDTAMLQEAAMGLGSDLYILPSSIHEVLLLPAGKCDCPDKLDSLVTEVNQMIVSDNERLSGHAYCYMRDSREIRQLTEIGG